MSVVKPPTMARSDSHGIAGMLKKKVRVARTPLPRRPP